MPQRFGRRGRGEPRQRLQARDQRDDITTRTTTAAPCPRTDDAGGRRARSGSTGTRSAWVFDQIRQVRGTGRRPAVGRRCPSGSDPESLQGISARRRWGETASRCPVHPVAGGQAGDAHRSHPGVVLEPPRRPTLGARRGPDATHRGWGDGSGRAAPRDPVPVSPRRCASARPTCGGCSARGCGRC